MGYTCLAFDYRNFGGSTGKPRGLISVPLQLEDFHAAIAYVRSLPEVDADSIAVMGSSFGGGNVIQVASQDPTIKATISQCPFTHGLRSGLKLGILPTPFILARALRDWFWSSTDNPVTISLVGNPGEVALMNAPDAMEGYKALVPKGHQAELNVPARAALSIPFQFPGSKASQVKSPILFAICKNDSVAPAGATESYAKTAPQATIKYYDCGHFDIYNGKWFEMATKDYVSFLQKNMPIKAKL